MDLTDLALSKSPQHLIGSEIFQARQAPFAGRISSSPGRYALFYDVFSSELVNLLLSKAEELEGSYAKPHLHADGALADREYYRSYLAIRRFYFPAFLQRLWELLPHALERMGLPFFSVRNIECRLSAYRAGDFIALHQDRNTFPLRGCTRHLTFVYYFFREPKRFQGGDLVLYGDRLPPHSDGPCDQIGCTNNTLVFFWPSTVHQVTPIECASGQIADSRFTIGGWLHKPNHFLDLARAVSSITPRPFRLLKTPLQGFFRFILN